MSENKMGQAYRHLLQSAKEALMKAEYKSWDSLKEAIETIQTKESVLEQLSRQELNQVQKDLKEDINQLATTLEEYDEGVESFIEMDLPLIEKYIEEKALSLADPTELMLLRLRINAALSD